MDEHSLFEPCQSAYRECHSTETALLKVKTDILNAMDKKEAVMVILLDLSAAFDTVSHPKMIMTLRDRIGLRDSALDWFTSYLNGRSQAVQVKNETSTQNDLTRGVPQGSILGPLLFTIYTLELGDIARKHGISSHFYADDTQLYLSFASDRDGSKHGQEAMMRLEHCVSDIKNWMAHNCLQLNDSKTELICFKSQRSKISDSSFKLRVGSSEVTPSNCVRNLGVLMDEHLAMDAWIKKTCAVCFMHLRDIAAIRSSLTESAAIALVHALISSRIDYCNSLLCGVTSSQLQKLQRVQNSAARVVTLTSKFDSATDQLRKLHWLPVAARIKFKILLFCFKALNGLTPKYISDLLRHHETRRPLRQNPMQLSVPRTFNKFGDSSFSSYGPKLWNSLPNELKNEKSTAVFKKDIKTHLFNSVFN